MFEYVFWLIAGTLYGFVIGLIPVAGATTALITIYSFIDVFRADPYTLVVFTTAIVVSSTIGDSFASIMLNVPGAGGSAASMVDGFPLAKKGQGVRALSAAISTSGVNGLIWGILVFAFLPFYAKVILYFGIPEQLAFITLAFTSVVFITNQYWFRGILSLILGIAMGLVGLDPITGEPRGTFGFQYLKAGIQLAPLMAGVLAFPELIEMYRTGVEKTQFKINNFKQQLITGLKDSLTHYREGLRGGFVGAIVGIIPGIGGSIADWVSYSQTVAANKNEKFGDGNIKGVIGCEGANNAQKATSYVPTILFGIPGAPFEAVIMSLFIIVGLEMGTPTLLKDTTFFNVIFSSYFASLIITLLISFVAIKYIIKFFDIPVKIWFWLLIALITWSCVQYTGYIEDYIILGMCIILGFGLKTFKMSRAAFIIGFVLSDRFEKLLVQYTALHQWSDILTRPISSTIVIIVVALATYGLFFNKARVNYT